MNIIDTNIIPCSPGIRLSAALIPPSPIDVYPVESRTPASWIPLNPDGSLSGWQKNISFNPADVRQGDRIGHLTVISELRVRENRKHGWPCTCTWGSPSSRESYAELTARNPVSYPAWTDETSSHPPECSYATLEMWAFAVCACERGNPLGDIITISGDHMQRWSCKTCQQTRRYGQAGQTARRDVA